jgi:hypothetical protein
MQAVKGELKAFDNTVRDLCEAHSVSTQLCPWDLKDRHWHLPRGVTTYFRARF